MAAATMVQAAERDGAEEEWGFQIAKILMGLWSRLNHSPLPSWLIKILLAPV
jgi:hypothetical protein